MKIEKEEETDQCPGTCNIPDSTVTSNKIVQCRCLQGKPCSTTIRSNHYQHFVTCGSISETILCGGPLHVKKFEKK